MPKKYLVEISESAETDIYRIWAHIAADNPLAADRWYVKVRQTVARLETLPFAFAVIPEAAEWGVEWRQKLLGNYRIIYRVHGNRVLVLRVVHGSRLIDPTMFLG